VLSKFQIKKAELSEKRRVQGKTRKAYKVLFGTSAEKVPLVRHRRRR